MGYLVRKAESVLRVQAGGGVHHARVAAVAPRHVFGGIAVVRSRLIGRVVAMHAVFAAICGLFAVARSDGAITYHSSLSSWNAAVGGSNFFNFEFPEMEASPQTGVGRFREEYAPYGMHGGYLGAGTPCIQPGMPAADAYFNAYGLESGLIGSGFNNFTFDAPTTGLAFRFVGNVFLGWLTQLKLYRGEKLLEVTYVDFNQMFQYGWSQGGGNFSKLFAFTSPVPFDRAMLTASYPSAPVEDMFAPLSIPAPSAVLVMLLGCAMRRRARFA
jgi:hypothetical protein